MAGLAAAMAEAAEAPLVVYLEGDLGAGKTTFARAFIRSQGYAGNIKSPTYGLLEKYPLDRFDVVHLDLYRIVKPGELEFLGIEDLCDERAVFMIEWPDRGDGFLPQADLEIRFEHDRDTRLLVFQAKNDKAGRLCRKLAGYFK
jgi:tRNA threonylcarbamoyladenosine biosynthesis protein TsaE